MNIALNGRMDSDLNWKKEREQALFVESIVWILDLGLFSELRFPLTHQGQLCSLRMALEHFRDTFWKEFESRTKSIVLYQGVLHEVYADYLNLLVDGFSDLPFHLELGVIEDPWQEVLLRHQLPKFHIRVEQSKLPLDKEANFAVLLPSKPQEGKLAQTVRELKRPFRIIPEANFLYEWSGVDTVLVESVEPQLMRQLQGFIAAEGTVIQVAV